MIENFKNYREFYSKLPMLSLKILDRSLRNK